MRGSCLCGKIEYEASRLDSPIEHCSCRTCRKAHAAAFNSSAGVLRAHFRWLRGERMLAAYESSPGKRRYFCTNCGSHLVAEIEGDDELILRVATLDEDPRQKPECQIWQSHEVPWLEYGPQIPAYPEWEPGH
ncbi:MAG: GFA family protein [Gammaproteobacteria bacterium]|nr:GFA family protein [Gammaproteobacteria bacterium]MDH4256109.1 GFA family protein [Gammaproteobacteria bacterium]MDH5309127.1 GFA family protein [Gammaproteobacteria bacterium]